MKWNVVLSKTGSRDLRQLDSSIRERLVRAMHRYATDGYGDIETIKPFCGEYRLRVGDWRILFALDASRGEMVVQRVRNRRDAYRD